MPCYHPVDAYLLEGGGLTFDKGARGITSLIQIPCNRCVGCRLERSKVWAARCMHEASLYPENQFITLTFDPRRVAHPDINYKAWFQPFMKRLRWKFRPRTIRFFMCGEYGEQFSRPHFHALLFNFRFPDLKQWMVKGDQVTYRSGLLEQLWPHGFSTCGNVSYQSAAYVARYVMKKMNGDLALTHYLMSNVLSDSFVTQGGMGACPHGCWPGFAPACS